MEIILNGLVIDDVGFALQRPKLNTYSLDYSSNRVYSWTLSLRISCEVDSDKSFLISDLARGIGKSQVIIPHIGGTYTCCGEVSGYQVSAGRNSVNHFFSFNVDVQFSEK